MKKILAIYILTVLSIVAFAQEADSIEAIEPIDLISKDLPPFTGIRILGNKVTVQIIKAEKQYVGFNLDAEDMSEVVAEVNEGILEISTKKLSKEVEVTVETNELNYIETQNVAKVIMNDEFASENFDVVSSGTSEMTLLLKVNELNTKISGASEITLKGSADLHNLNIDGAAEVKASEFETVITSLNIDGAGDAEILASEEIKGEIGGAAKLEFIGDPDVSNLKVSGAAVLKGKGKKQVIIGDNNDTLDLKIGGYNFKITEEDKKKFKELKEMHEEKVELWSGIDIGVTGYLNNDNNTSLPTGYEFLELNYAKSLQVGFNLFEQDIPIIKNLIEIETGLGFEINNYKFANKSRLNNDPVQLSGFSDNTNTFSKTKLRTTYLTLPVLLEINTSKDPDKAFHFAGGLLLGYNIGNKVKLVYNLSNKKEKYRDDNNFFVEPFRYGLTARVGYGDNLMLYANYALSNMFKANKGPELNQFAIGLAFSGN